jgi:hypothetical protein
MLLFVLEFVFLVKGVDVREFFFFGDGRCGFDESEEW